MSNAGIPLMSIFKCARPLLFETGIDEYPYCVNGTAFILRFRGRHFIVSAAHLLRGFEVDQVRFQYHPSASDFVVWNAVHRLRGLDQDDTNQYDLVVFAVDEAILDCAMFNGYEPYDLQAFDALTIYSTSSNYAFRGFPTHLRTPDYELRHIETQSVVGDGRYEGPTSRKSLHRLRVSLPSDIGDFDGLSGSPLFQINHDGSRYSNVAFAGMAVLGTATAGTLEFLEHRRIIEVLTLITEGMTVPVK